MSQYPDIYFGPNQRISVPTGDAETPYRQVTTREEGIRVKEDRPALRAELLRQGGIECISRKFYAMPGVNEISIQQPEGWEHKHTVRGEDRCVEIDCPECCRVLLRDCVDDPAAIGSSSAGTRPFPGQTAAKMVRERRWSGAFQWSLNPANRPYAPAELEAMQEAEAIEQERRVRAAAGLFG